MGNGRKKNRPTQPPTTTPTGWTFYYGQPNPAMNADGVSSNWTESPYVEPHYWLKGWTTPFLPSQSISIAYKIEALSGTPVVHSTECTASQNSATLARAALFIGSGSSSGYYDRAWFMTRGPLTIGTHTITAPFNSPSWTFVNANTGPVQNPSQWAAILANANKIGLTFNGCSSMGHGVFVVGGSVKITIVSVTVQ